VSAAALAGVILAAGLSSRMRELKPLLPLDGAPAVLRVAGAYRAVGLEAVVVLGFGAERVAPLLDAHDVGYVVNHEFEDGMYSSVRCGVRALPADVRAFFVHPVDCALVRSETLGLLARSSSEPPTGVAYPVHDAERGHPPLVPAALRDAILTEESDGGLKELLTRGEAGACDVQVDDPNVLLDMDDAAAYERLVKLAVRERIPASAACLDLLARLGTPAPVVAHAAAVAASARRLAAALRTSGTCLDVKLLEAAALLHDVARDAPAHAEAGAAVLDDEGYPRVAAVVCCHMQLPGPPPELPGEREVLYLADKLTVGSRAVGLDARRERAEAVFASDPEALKAALERLEAARVIAARIESLARRPLSAILEGSVSTAGADVPDSAA
jgi:CTP:molybdopterin cytidylyltransferase MocA/HD superfamily phosphohydrolase YqeK